MRMYSVKIVAYGEHASGQVVSWVADVLINAEDAEAACVAAVDYADQMAPMGAVRWKSFEWLEAASQTFPKITWRKPVKLKRQREPHTSKTSGTEP